MTTAHRLGVYLAALIAFLALDVAWLGLFASGFFRSELGGLLRGEPNLAPAAVFYLIHVLALVVLVIGPALESHSLGQALRNGGLLGLAAYATFDLTNLAIIEGWTWRAAIVDMAWGTFATALAAAAGYGAGASARRLG